MSRPKMTEDVYARMTQGERDLLLCLAEVEWGIGPLAQDVPKAVAKRARRILEIEFAIRGERAGR